MMAFYVRGGLDARPQGAIQDYLPRQLAATQQDTGRLRHAPRRTATLAKEEGSSLKTNSQSAIAWREKPTRKDYQLPCFTNCRPGVT